ncbi:hypothetical protein EMCRGX_G016183 [Ephydatia muelleri]
MSIFSLPFSNSTELAVAYRVYFVVSISGACLGFVGASFFLYQVRSEETTSTRRRMLTLLGLSDLLADMGVIVKSVYWLIAPASVGPPFAVETGATVLECWVLFWYLSTFFSTFFYVADIYNSSHCGQWRSCYSCGLTWLFCLLFASLAALVVWTGDSSPLRRARQSVWADGSYKEDSSSVIAYLSCFYGSLVVLLVSLPFFFISVLRQDNLKRSITSGVKADELAQAHQQMISTVLSFYFSWTLSGLDGIMLIIAHLEFSAHPSLIKAIFDAKYIYIIWLLEGLLNPLQSLLRVSLYHCMVRLGQLRHMVRDRRTLSTSGECISVDFRHGRGNVKHVYTDKPFN